MKSLPTILPPVAALALVIAAYGNSLHNSFHFDDSHVIENNLYIRSLSNVPRFFADASTFSSLPSHGSYRPLVSATLALDYAIGGGLDPVQFHRTQIALLVALGVALVAFYTRALVDLAGVEARWAPLVAATLFAVHTANTETLNLISARSELLSVLGVVLSFLVYQRLPRLRSSGLHLVPMLVGALAKIHAVMYAPLVFAYAWLTPREATPAARTRQALRTTWPALAIGAAAYVAIRRFDTAEWVAGGSDRLAYLRTQPFVWMHYVRLFFLPVGLTADTDWQVFAAWYDSRAIVGYLFVVALAAIVVRTWRARDTRPIAFGVAWFAIAVAPTSSVVALAEVANEHRIFFPYVGLALAAVWTAALAVERARARSWIRPLAVAAALALLAAHGAGTWTRNRVWRTEASLWLDVTAKSPQNGRGLMNYGLTLMQRGNLAGARDYFERAAALTPNYSTLHINMGIVYGALDRPSVAEEHFRRALALAPDMESHFYFGRWLAGAGRGPEALEHYRAALALSPGRLEVREALMRLDAAAGDEQDLIAVARRTLEIVPQHAIATAYVRGQSPLAARAPTEDAAMKEGLAALGTRQFDEAAEFYRHMIRLNPNSADAWNNLGWAQLQLGFARQAVLSFQTGLSLDPTHERAKNNLALAVKAVAATGSTPSRR